MEAVTHWRAMHLVGQGTTHIIGFMQDHQRYRVTSPVVAYDADTDKVLTLSGSHYRLEGAPGDADLLLRGFVGWMIKQNVNSTVEDVTENFHGALIGKPH